MSFENHYLLGTSVSPTLQVRIYAMLLLPVVGN